MNLSTLHHPSGGELIFDRISGVLSYDQQDKIEKFFLSNEFPWYHHLNTVDPTSQESKLFDDFGFHTHNFLLKGKLKSPLFQEAINLIELGQFMKEYNISPNLYNAHISMFSQRDRIVIPPPHIDLRNCSHTVILYYINDGDGDTIFYNKCEKDDEELLSSNHKDMKEWRRESPKKGDFLVFDGSIYHSPSCPIESRCRLSLNFDCKI